MDGSDFKRIYASVYSNSNRYLKAVCSRGLLPSFISKQRVQCLINYIDCEAHRKER